MGRGVRTPLGFWASAGTLGVGTLRLCTQYACRVSVLGSEGPDPGSGLGPAKRVQSMCSGELAHHGLLELGLHGGSVDAGQAHRVQVVDDAALAPEERRLHRFGADSGERAWSATPVTTSVVRLPKLTLESSRSRVAFSTVA